MTTTVTTMITVRQIENPTPATSKERRVMGSSTA